MSGLQRPDQMDTYGGLALRSAPLPSAPAHSARRESSRSRGFTLTELLVVVAIIAILASMVLFVMSSARSSAREAATRGQIVVLHELIMRKWESFATRRVKVVAPPNPTSGDRLAIDEERVKAMYTLLMYELPENWEEVTFANMSLEDPSQASASGVSMAYQDYYFSNPITDNPTEEEEKQIVQFASAETLYMIVTVGLAEEGGGRENFPEHQIGDVDEDGFPEFIDSWGTPIRFIRWPIGFIDDPNQPLFGHLSDLMPEKLSSTSWPDVEKYPDPFDPRKTEPVSFLIYPLIYSAGPDKIFDIYSGSISGYANVPYVSYETGSPLPIQGAPPSTADYDPLGGPDTWSGDGQPPFIGVPKDLNAYIDGPVEVNGKLNHYDNIHNHQIRTATQ